MFNNIAFIGGIHGVGKSTICKQICKHLDLQYLSASNVLKWAEINADHNNKYVQNIHDTQDRLVDGLSNMVDPNSRYLLDGHFCLFDIGGNVTRVPINTFKIINPISLSIVIGNILDIKAKLEKRDSKIYGYELLDTMQKEELAYAKELSSELNVSINVGDQTNYEEIVLSLEKTFDKK
jgi:adenylate kinase